MTFEMEDNVIISRIVETVKLQILHGVRITLYDMWKR